MEPDVAAAREELGLEPDARVLTVMPGSRMSELKYNTEAFIQTAKLLLKRDPASTNSSANGPAQNNAPITLNWS